MSDFKCGKHVFTKVLQEKRSPFRLKTPKNTHELCIHPSRYFNRCYIGPLGEEDIKILDVGEHDSSTRVRARGPFWESITEAASD